MSSNYPSRRPSTRFAQLEACQVCNRLRDHQELRESLAHPGLLACADCAELECTPGYREYQRDQEGPVFSEQDVSHREEPIGGDISIYTVGE